MRPKPWVKDELQKKLSDAFPPDFDPATTVGMPIRASDKCEDHNLRESAFGEIKCINQVKSYLMFAEAIREFDPAVNTLLVSSEDSNVIKEVIDYVKDQYVKGLKSPGMAQWKLILNEGDTMQGSGSATFLQDQADMGRNSISEQVVSALSSLYFQMHSRYLLTNFRSSFTIMSYLMHLEDSITFSKNRMRFSVYDSKFSSIDEQQSRLKGMMC